MPATRISCDNPLITDGLFWTNFRTSHGHADDGSRSNSHVQPTGNPRRNAMTCTSDGSCGINTLAATQHLLAVPHIPRDSLAQLGRWQFTWHVTCTNNSPRCLWVPTSSAAHHDGGGIHLPAPSSFSRPWTCGRRVRRCGSYDNASLLSLAGLDRDTDRMAETECMTSSRGNYTNVTRPRPPRELVVQISSIHDTGTSGKHSFRWPTP